MADTKRIRTKMDTTRPNLTSMQKKQFAKFLNGKATSRETAEAMGMSTMKVYTLGASILRNAVMDGTIDAKEVLSNF